MPRPELTERAFRKFERIIQIAHEMYPAVAQVSVSSTGLMKSTLIGRIRDSMRSLSIYKWPTEWKVDHARLRAIVVTEDPKNDDNVLLGPRSNEELKAVLYPAMTRWTPEQRIVDDVVHSSFVILQDPTSDLIEAYVMLANVRPVGLPRLWIARTPNNNAVIGDLLHRLEAGNDIAVIVNDDHWIVL